MQQQIATLALAAACLCLAANGAMIAKRGSSESQMQYGGRPVDPSDIEETSSTSTGPAWPIGSVPGMNVYDLYSYEQAHNFDLRPSSRRSSPSSSPHQTSEDLPPNEALITDTSPQETLLTTDLLPHEVMSSVDAATPTVTYSSLSADAATKTASPPTTTPRALLDKRLVDIWPWEVITSLADGQIAPQFGLCKSDWIGDWIARRDLMTATKLGPQAIVDRYLPYLDFRAAMKRNEQARERRANLPYGVVEVKSGVTVYTDMSAYKMAVVTWYNARTGIDNVCGDATPPLLRVTTKSAVKTTTTKRAQDSVTKKMTGANANAKFTVVNPASVLNYRREVDDGRTTPREVDAGTVTRVEEWRAQGTETVSWTA